MVAQYLLLPEAAVSELRSNYKELYVIAEKMEITIDKLLGH